MAMTASTMADKILANISAPMTASDRTTVRAGLIQFCGGNIEEIQVESDIEMDAADINVLPGSFKDSTNAPITGAGANASFNLNGKIK